MCRQGYVNQRGLIFRVFGMGKGVHVDGHHKKSGKGIKHICLKKIHLS